MKTSDFLKALDEQSAVDLQNAKEQKKQELSTANTQAVIDSIGVAVKTLMAFQAQHQPKVEVTNQKLPTSVKTPDVQKVVDALNNLKQPLQENKPDDTKVVDALNKLNDSIKKLPTAFPELPEPVEEVTVKNQPDYTKQFDNLGKAIKSIDIKPVVNVPEEKPDDYSPIVNALTSVIKAVQAIKIPKVPTTDLTPLINATNAIQTSIESLRFPVPNYVLPFINTNGDATQSPAPLIDEPYDYIGFSNPDVNNNYQTIQFDVGGAGGTTVRTLTLTYDDNSTVTSISRT